MGSWKRFYSFITSELVIVTPPFLVFFFFEMTSSKNKAFLNTSPPSSPGKDVSPLKQMMIHPSEGSLSSTSIFLSLKSAFNQLLTRHQLTVRVIYANGLVAWPPHPICWTTTFITSTGITFFLLNGKHLKLKKYSALFSLTGISKGCTTRNLQVLLRRQMSF